MTNKGKVYGVTVIDHALQANIKQLADIKDVPEPVALRMAAERYFSLSFKEREKLEGKQRWRQHRNRGFRSLTTFAERSQKPKAKAHVLPREESPLNEAPKGSE